MCTTRHFAINMDEKGSDGMDMDDELEAPESEKEVADRQAKKYSACRENSGYRAG